MGDYDEKVQFYFFEADNESIISAIGLKMALMLMKSKIYEDLKDNLGLKEEYAMKKVQSCI